MANGAALIRESLWHDRDYRAIPRTAQCLYLQLLSQKDLDCAGVLTLNKDLLAKGCDEMTAADLCNDLKTLAEARFVVVDEDSDEVLIRSYVRLVTVKSPNAWKSAKMFAGRIHSPLIRSVLASELRRLGRTDAEDLANKITADQTPSASHTDPIHIPSERDIPSEPHPDASVPVPVPVPSLRPVDGNYGEAPPPKTCHEHPHGTDAPCRRCGTARQTREAWELSQTQARAQQAANLKAERELCEYCDENGLREINDTIVRCTHDPTTDLPF